MLRALSLGLKFLLELAAFAAFAYWGATTADGVVAVVPAIVAPSVAIALWALFAAPRSGRRLATAPRIVLELVVFALAVVALFAAGARTAAIVMAVLVVTSTVLLSVLDQWEA
jgi:hypothetical protein